LFILGHVALQRNAVKPVELTDTFESGGKCLRSAKEWRSAGGAPEAQTLYMTGQNATTTARQHASGHLIDGSS
jgi:hypothetical protein